MIERECELNLCAKWLATNSSQLVGEKPAATTNSFLICFNGGIIEPETSGQGPAGVGKSPPLPEEHPALNLLKELFILLNDENLGRFRFFSDNDNSLELILKAICNVEEVLLPGSKKRAERFGSDPNMDTFIDLLVPFSMLIEQWRTTIRSNAEIPKEEINNTLIKYALINSGYVDKNFDFAGMNPIKRNMDGGVTVSFTTKEGKKTIVKSFNLIPDYKLSMGTQIKEVGRFWGYTSTITDVLGDILPGVAGPSAKLASFVISSADPYGDYKAQLDGFKDFTPEPETRPEKTDNSVKNFDPVIAIVVGGSESFGTVDKDGSYNSLYSEEIKRK